MAGHRPGELSIRVSGKFYSIKQLIEDSAKQTSSPETNERNIAGFIFIIMFIAMRVSGCNLGGFMTLLLSLCVHEAGHGLGMVLVGWSRVRFCFGSLPPMTWADEDISAGRKMVVALSGPALGLIAAMGLGILGSAENAGFMVQLSNALFLITLLNLFPVKPFDGYTVAEHLVFVRHPKVEMFYLGVSGVVMILASLHLFDFSRKPEHFPFFGIFFMLYGYMMFHGVKKIDNMADMVVRLRQNAKSDYKAGRYAPDTIKKMEFSLAMFDLPNEVSVAIFLRELWDKAWEAPPKAAETVFSLALYAMLIASFQYSDAARTMAIAVLHKVGF